VDPALPAEILASRLHERCGLKPEAIDIVFLTCFRPVHRRGLMLFDHARWMMHEEEIEAIGRHLAETAERAADDEEISALVRSEIVLLERFQPAPDRLTPSVHLYPAPGATPGNAGLLLAMPSRTTIIAGDAILTQDHYEAGRLSEQVVDLERAEASFRDILEIADEIIPGHDNRFPVRGRTEMHGPERV
jgi:glyoxylase-like metal-dependent hydrolase (beta-lactamase superfamily II)